jgi:conjugative relaxase-like TrwC/TraI family protein
MVATIANLSAGGRDHSYYLERCATSREEYYTGAGEAAGYWAGSAAQGLNLAGEVVGEHFRDLLVGRDPFSGDKLKKWSNTTLGYDVTFSAVKSVSALYALAPADVREVIAEAQAEAVAAGLRYLEQHACVARLGAQGCKSQVAQGFIAAAFFQRTSREGDPQLHTHTVIANFVTSLGGRTAAADGKLIYRACKAAGAVYDAQLRTGLTRRLGLAWERRGDSIEIAAIRPGLCEHWSTRRRQIEEQMREWGQSSARAAQSAAYATRRTKGDKEADVGLNDRWRKEAEAWEGRERSGADLDRLHIQATRVRDGLARLSEDEIVDRLLGPQGLTEKRSSFGRSDVVQGAAELLHPQEFTPERVQALADRVLADERVIRLLAPGRPTSGEVIKVRDEHGRIQRTVFGQREQRFSTAELLEVEREVLDRVSARVGDGTGVIDPATVDAVIARYNAENPTRTLDAGQEAAVRALCADGNGVSVIVGRAGTGKSATARVYRMIQDAAHTPVLGVAPSATAAHQLSMSAGIEDCGTVHLLLTRLDKTSYRLPYAGVIVLDEASMVDSRTFLELQRAADEAGCKIALMGDPKQIGSVDTGGLLADIAERTNTYELTRNYRFDDERQRIAAELVRDGQTDRAIGMYRKLGLLHEFDKAADACDHLVDQWFALRKTGASIALATDTRWLTGELNDRIRARLKAEGQIARRERRYDDDVTGRSIRLAKGDYVRLCDNNGWALQDDGTRAVLRNGMVGEVTEVTKHGVRVKLDEEHIDRDGRQDRWLSARYTAASVLHGWASTCDGVEGVTRDHALYAATDRASLERGYVAVSRGRQTNEIYAAKDSGWEDDLAIERNHEPASRQKPCFDREQVQALAREETKSARQRWLEQREAERQREMKQELARTRDDETRRVRSMIM